VRFEVENVVDDFSTFWDTASFDVVFCRNLLIYLTPKSIERTISRIARALTPGGYLFLGHAETGLAGKQFSAHHGHDAFYFRQQEPTATAQPRRETEVAPTWLETIERSGERVQALTTSAVTDAAISPPPPASEHLLDLLRLERFAEALTLLESAEAGSERGLLRAAVLTNLGRTADAAAACEQRLAAVPSCAFAHYLLGLCHEQRGATQDAKQHHTRSATLDSSFALPRLRAGMLARRAGALDEARRLLREALLAFPRQGARTQLLYGGGIATEALEALCRTELTACEKAR
jgi:chemotaxis protein methyltransferase CheR